MTSSRTTEATRAVAEVRASVERHWERGPNAEYGSTMYRAWRESLPRTRLHQAAADRVGLSAAPVTAELAGAVLSGWVRETFLATASVPASEWGLVDACQVARIATDGVGRTRWWTFIWVHEPTGVAALTYAGHVWGDSFDASRLGTPFVRFGSPQETRQPNPIYRDVMDSFAALRRLVVADRIEDLIDQRAVGPWLGDCLAGLAGVLSSPVLVTPEMRFLGELAARTEADLSRVRVFADGVGLVPVREEPWVPRLE